MQTFLPYPDFAQSASVLDNKRLGKQRVECWQIFDCLIGTPSRYANHPAVLMWKNYELALVIYGVAICTEWTNRGYRDTIRDKLIYNLDLNEKVVMPPWLGYEKLHSNHRARLMAKQSDWYRRFNWLEKPVLVNFWPVVNGVLLPEIEVWHGKQK